jgi:dihydropteroate synthase
MVDMYAIQSKGRLLSLSSPKIMGILNLTPDSFYADSRISLQSLADRAGAMIENGADILDLGGQSTRPNSESVEANEEADRVLPAVELLAKSFPQTILSIDTYYASVAYQACSLGAGLVNDVSGGSLDEAMIDTVAKCKVPFVCMHMRGTPQSMQSDTHYNDLMGELLDYFTGKINQCHQAGIVDVILDPGFGFAKDRAQNFHLLGHLETLHILHKPLLVGLSRKSMIYKTLGGNASTALNGTSVLNTLALQKGAHILRVHDVKEAKEAVQLFQAVQEQA